MSRNFFNPNDAGVNNGHFIGLPFSEDQANIVIISVPWDVTVSYREGTSKAPELILNASTQLDLYDPEISEAWKLGIFVRPPKLRWKRENDILRPLAQQYIAFIEQKGRGVPTNSNLKKDLFEINASCRQLNNEVYAEALRLIHRDKLVGVLGGDHSTALGLLKACKETYGNFSVMQMDAHMDLRKSYEEFTFSHASVFYNAIKSNLISNLVQVGIRDNCEEEVHFAEANNVSVFYDYQLKEAAFQGKTWQHQCDVIIADLSEQVYISFDVDGLSPHLCPTTGTPVPGGIEFQEAIYLIKSIVKSGRKIIGFDLCEAGGHTEWDANVSARILYNLCNWAGRSQKLV